MPRIKVVDGVSMPLTAAEEAQRDAEEAAWLAAKPAFDKEAANAPILARIEAKEKQIIRSMTELRRAPSAASVDAHLDARHGETPRPSATRQHDVPDLN